VSERIPFVDLVTPHREIEEEINEVLRAAIHDGRFIGGPMVEGFENDFAKFCGTRFCIGVSSGTDALRFALMASGVHSGDVVITVPNTFIATTEAITQAGAVPEFIDIDDRTYTMDVVKLREYLEKECDRNGDGKTLNRSTGRRVSAIIPVHLYGQMADMDPILEIATHFGLTVIEDACQAHGAEYFSKKDGEWRKAGSMGKAAAFSFYPGKNLGALGEAGAVTTDDEEMACKIRMIRDHGQEQKYIHVVEGYNGRLDAIQAGFLRIKLRRLQEWNKKRRMNARSYDELLDNVDEVRIPFIPEWTRCVYHLYVIRVQDRDDLQRYLDERGIGTGLHYPVPLHLQKAYQWMNSRQWNLPVSEKVADEILSLPMHPELTQEQVKRVAGEIGCFVSATKDGIAKVCQK